jgi:hypothetical protein
VLPARVHRHALGLPAGSIRAILAIMVLGLLWILMVLPEEKQIQIPVYLFYLTFLILGHFFAAHGHSIAAEGPVEKSPLYLPRGTLRTLFVLGFVAVLGWRYYVHRDWNDLLKLKDPLIEQAYLPLILVGAFFIGVFVARVVTPLISGPDGPSPWFQDIQAWVALLAAIGLGVEFLIHLVINPSLDEAQRVELPGMQIILASIISFYYGARS